MGHGGSAPLPDEELVCAVREGDPHAFDALYKEHVRLVARVAGEQLRDPEAIADVVQETFLRALEQLANLREPRLFRPWLLAIARNAAIDEQRRGARRGTMSDGEMSDMASTGLGPEEEGELAELIELVTDGVATLSQRDAVTLSMVTKLGFSSGEVAGALGLSPGAAKVALHRARRRLRTAVSLRVLVAAHSMSCEALAGLLAADDAVGAARHVAGCPSCASTAKAEVDLYGPAPAAL
jgi:RNA polymerase sigma factor (sigma-70 family)